jgi:putative ABC transport system permease protein
MSSVRRALRAFLHRPALSLTVAALFALTVGFTAGLWAIIDATLLKPLPYPAPDNLVAVFEVHPTRGGMAVTPANFLDWARNVPAFESAAGSYPVDASLVTQGMPVRVSGARVTEEFFAVWGVPATLGRVLSPADFAGGAPAVVIGHQLWLDHFAGRRDVVGSTVRIDGAPYSIAGVMPATFRRPRGEQIWVPWLMTPDERRERRFHLVSAVARLRNGEGEDQARTQLTLLYERLSRDHAEVREWRPEVTRLRTVLAGESTRAVPLMTGALGLLLAVAWANLVGLLLGAWPERREEIRLRMALGASTRQLVTHLLVEVAIWATVGAAAGLMLAKMLVQIAGPVLFLGTTFDFEPRIDARVVAFVIAFLVVTLVAIVLGPLTRTVARVVDLAPRRARPRRVKLGAVSAIAQVAGSVVLLALSASLATAFIGLMRVAESESGSNLLAMEVSLSELQQPDETQHRAFFSTLLNALQSRAEVAEVSAASYVPPAPPLGNIRFDIDGRAETSDHHSAVESAVSPAAFHMLGVRLVRGRLLGPGDGEGAPLVAVVSESLARRYWPDEDPIGQRVRVVGVPQPMSIVGIVADVHQPLAQDSRIESLMYLSYLQTPWPFMTVVVRARADAGGAVRAVREEVARLGPDQATGEVRLLSDVRTEWLVAPRARATLVALFGAAALLLTLVGIHGSVRREVVSRDRECAIRQALGASPAQVTIALTVPAVIATAMGLLCGIAALWVLVPPLQRRIADVPAVDATSLVAMVLLTAAAAGLAAYLPARRARATDIAQTLRAER